MSVNFRLVAAVLVFCGLAPGVMAATCTSSKAWGSLGPPDFQTFANSFNNSGSYLDCYTFSLSSTANSFGGLLEIDPWFNKLDIDVTSVGLFRGGVLGGQTTGALIGSDFDSGFFGFGSLSAGTFTFAVASAVDRDFGPYSYPVGYWGLFSTVAVSSNQVPEPDALALLGAALLGLAFTRRRKR